jgi:hypothetical protein
MPLSSLMVDHIMKLGEQRAVICAGLERIIKFAQHVILASQSTSLEYRLLLTVDGHSSRTTYCYERRLDLYT